MSRRQRWQIDHAKRDAYQAARRRDRLVRAYARRTHPETLARRLVRKGLAPAVILDRPVTRTTTTKEES